MKVKLTGILILVLAFFYYPFLRLSASKQENKSGELKILVIPILTRIGDLVCATPVFRAIKEKYPDCYLAVLATNKTAGIVKNNPRIDEIIIYNTWGVWRTIGKIRAANFTWGFNLAGTSLGTALSVLGRIKERVKTAKEEKETSEILTDWMNNYSLLYKNHTYLPRHYLKLLKFIGIENPQEKKEVFITLAGKKKTNEFLNALGLSEGDILIGISITAGNKIKEWGDEKFKILAERLTEKYGAKIVFIGGTMDEERIDKVLKESGRANFLKATDFALEELPSLIKKLDLYVAADTGLIHIAHSLGIPLIDIVGPVDWRELGPKNERSFLIKPFPEIKPSIFVFKRPGPMNEHKKALDSILVEDVLKAAEQLISRKN